MNTSKPHFALTRIYDDGTQEQAEILPVTALPLEASMGRRGFLGAGLTVAGVLKLMSTAEAAQNDAAPAGANLPANSGLPAHADKVLALAISPDGKVLSSCSADKTIKLWSLAERALIQRRAGSAGSVLALAISPDGKTLGSGSVETDIRVWRLPDAAPERRFTGHSGWVGAMVFNPDGRTLISAGGDRSIRIFGMREGRSVPMAEGHRDQVLALAINRSGRLLVSGSADKTIKLWDLSELKLLATLNKHTDMVHAVAISPDGALLASGSFDKTICLWNMADRTVRHTLTGHIGNVNALAIHPSGNLLVSASSDGTLRLWSLSDGKLIKTMIGHNDVVWTLAISPDGNTLVSGAFDGTIRIWSLPDGESVGVLSDLSATPPTVSGVTYNEVNARGQTITYTLPCGSPIPAGAVCTCNCVPGTYVPAGSIPIVTQQPPGMIQPRPPMEVPSPKYGPHSQSVVVRPASRPSAGVGGGGTTCTCNKICTCIPVCQAHRLLHPDLIVRTMAEEILLWMGEREFEYMEWAANHADAALKAAIRKTMRAIRAGSKPDPSRWPAPAECLARLHDPDEIVGIMSAQMLSRQCLEHTRRLSSKEAQRVERLLGEAQRRPWFLRARQ